MGMSYTQGSRPVLGYVALPGLITRKFMPIHDVSGIEAWGMSYLSNVKNSPLPSSPRGGVLPGRVNV